MKLVIIAGIMIAGIGTAQAQGGFDSVVRPWNNPPQPPPRGGPNAFGNYDVYNSRGQQMGTYEPRLGGGYTYNPNPSDIGEQIGNSRGEQ
jgi:hypothetical protein